MTSNQRTRLISLVLVMLTVIVYLPALNGRFIWDDDSHLTLNPVVVGPLGLKEIWTTPAARICPLTLSCFWLQHALWGLNPLPYHMVSLALHASSGLLLWRILLRMQVPGAWFGALIWSVHPVQVESVAWITELKNTQSCFFYLLTILFYLKWMDANPVMPRQNRHGYYVLAVCFAAFAMASKSSTVVLPVVLGLFTWWFKEPLDWRLALRLAPFFVWAALASGVSIWTTQLEGAADEQWLRTWPERWVTAGNVVWFYIGKLLWPHPLIFIYPRWEIDAAKATSYLGIIAVFGMLCILWWKRHGWLRSTFFAFAYFLVALLPVLGLVEHYFLRYSFVGDHFQYLASLGFVPFVVACAAVVFQQFGPRGRWIGMTFGALAVTALGMLTWRHEAVFANDERLWWDTLSKNQTAWVAQNNFGNVLASQGKYAEAVDNYREAFRLNPLYAEAHYNLGIALAAQRKGVEAVEQFKEAVRLNPIHVDAHINLGVAYATLRDYEGAIKHFSEALRLNPMYPHVHSNLGNVLVAQHRFEEAISHYMEALRLDPSSAPSHNNLGIALERVDRHDEAESHFREALRLKPDYANAKSNLDRIRSR